MILAVKHTNAYASLSSKTGAVLVRLVRVCRGAVQVHEEAQQCAPLTAARIQ